MAGIGAGAHSATYRASQPPTGPTGQRTYVSDVTCSCGHFQSQARSFMSAADARTAAGRTFNGHVSQAAEQQHEQQHEQTAPARTPSSAAGASEVGTTGSPRVWPVLLAVVLVVGLLTVALLNLGGDGHVDRPVAHTQAPGSLTDPDRATPDAGAPSGVSGGEQRHRRHHGGDGSRAGSGSGGSSKSDTSGLYGDQVARGLTRADVIALGRVADLTGYGLGPDTALSFTQARDFAVAVTLTCDAVAAGEMTWSDAVAQDVADGAPTSAARTMNGYLRSVFCPQAT